MKKFIVMR